LSCRLDRARLSTLIIVFGPCSQLTERPPQLSPRGLRAASTIGPGGSGARRRLSLNSWQSRLGFLLFTQARNSHGAANITSHQAKKLCVAFWPNRSKKLVLGEFGIARLQPPTAATTRSLQFFPRFNSPLPNFPESAAGSAFRVCLLFASRRSSPHSSIQFQRRSYAKRRMPPKKAVKEEKILLGRPGNNLKSGIVCTDPTSTATRSAITLTW
jgi:hypothetical protein